jgi:hypothetical protein
MKVHKISIEKPGNYKQYSFQNLFKGERYSSYDQAEKRALVDLLDHSTEAREGPNLVMD